MSNQIDTFVYEGFDEAKPVRVVMRDDKPWFVAKDVCAILGIGNPSMAVEPLDEDEKAAISLTDSRHKTHALDDEKGVNLTHTPSQNREYLIISESGLYTLILRSRQAVTKGSPAHKFRRWVTGELLPQIRKEGRFGDNDPTADWDWDIIREKIQLVREMRLSLGKKAAVKLWEELALPMPNDDKEKNNNPTQGIEFVQQFLNDCTEEASGGRVQAAILYRAYCAWADRTNSPAMTSTGFGRIVTSLGLEKITSNNVYYLNLRLRHKSEMQG